MRALRLVFTSALLAAACASGARAQDTVELLVRQVQGGEWAAQGTAERVGPAGSAPLAAIAEGGGEQDHLAAVCLRLTGGPDAVACALRLIARDEQLAADGLAILRLNPPVGGEARLIEVYRRTKDEVVRDELPLIGGALAGASPASWLSGERQRRRLGADVPEATVVTGAPDGLVLALGRMGHDGARREVDARVARARGDDLVAWIDRLDAQAPGAPWLARTFDALLAREDVLLEVGADGRPTTRVRACDLAVTGAARVSGRTPTFPVARGRRYTPEQLAEVRRALGPGLLHLLPGS